MMNTDNLIPIAMSLDDVLNDHNIDDTVEFFTDDATVTMEELPSGKATLMGKQEIRQWIEQLLSQDFHVESTNYYAYGNTVTWDSAVHLYSLAKLGIDPAYFSLEVVFRDSKIATLTTQLKEESRRIFEQAMAEKQAASQ